MIVWKQVKRKEQVRNFVDPLKLKMPVFGALVPEDCAQPVHPKLRHDAACRCADPAGLDIVADTSGNVVVANAVRDVQESVRNGESLTAPLANHAVFPPMVVQMMAVGEDTGALDDMLHKISEFYDQEVEATTEALTSLIEPLMIAFLGGMVGSMIIALYMPIFKVFDLIE